MIRFCNYIFFEDENDFEENVEFRPAVNDFWHEGGIIRQKPESFPIVYHYMADPFISGCCGQWVETTVEKMMGSVKEEVRSLNDLLQKMDEKKG